MLAIAEVPLGPAQLLKSLTLVLQHRKSYLDEPLGRPLVHLTCKQPGPILVLALVLVLAPVLVLVRRGMA